MGIYDVSCMPFHVYNFMFHHGYMVGQEFIVMSEIGGSDNTEMIKKPPKK
jgi:hypothetical protein